jgi:hypothetical protein
VACADRHPPLAPATLTQTVPVAERIVDSRQSSIGLEQVKRIGIMTRGADWLKRELRDPSIVFSTTINACGESRQARASEAAAMPGRGP